MKNLFEEGSWGVFVKVLICIVIGALIYWIL